MLNNYKKIEIYGEHLKNKKIAFIVTGDSNAYKAPEMVLELRKYGCDIFTYITNDGLKYVTDNTLKWVSGNRNKKDINYDAIIIYPSTDNLIKQLVNGNIDDDIINNLIYQTKSKAPIICFSDLLFNIDSMESNEEKLNVKIINNLIIEDETEAKTKVSKIVRALSDSNLKGINVLVTAGPTPVKIDNVRRITNKFSGKLGIEIANELYLRGAKVMLFQSYSGIRPPKYIDQILFHDYEEYKELCTSNCQKYQYGIFSAAVADYMPKKIICGKIPSGGVLKNIELIQTEKVINLVQKKSPDLKMISFKYEEGKTLDQLIAIANRRLNNGHLRVVTNDLTLNDSKQKCFLCGLNENKITTVIDEASGKINIARMIVDDMERIIGSNN